MLDESTCLFMLVGLLKSMQLFCKHVLCQIKTPSAFDSLCCWNDVVGTQILVTCIIMELLVDVETTSNTDVDFLSGLSGQDHIRYVTRIVVSLKLCSRGKQFHLVYHSVCRYVLRCKIVLSSDSVIDTNVINNTLVYM